MTAATGPHAKEPPIHGGAPVEKALAAMIMIHGRGGVPEGILDLVGAINRPNVAYIAPAAYGGTWYPFPFISPRERNEPGLSSGLSVIESLVTGLLDRGFAENKIALLGFSQGACLASEFAIRHPRHYGGVLVLSGGLIGPPGMTWDDVTTTALTGTPVFLGCSDIDSHIPKERVFETEKVFKRLGARVRRTLYPGMGHVINEDEIAEVERVVDEMLASPATKTRPA
jgi:predicted esterase